MPPTRVPERLCWVGGPDTSVEHPTGVDLLVLGATSHAELSAYQANADGRHIIGIDGSDHPQGSWAGGVGLRAKTKFLRETRPGVYAALPIALPFHPAFAATPQKAGWERRTITALWAGAAGSGARAGLIAALPACVTRVAERLTFDAWRDRLADSKAVICLRGEGDQTYRYWEAAAAGCVVIAERLRVKIPADLVDGESGFVFDSTSQIQEIVEGDHMTADVARAGHALAWSHHTPEATARYVLEHAI